MTNRREGLSLKTLNPQDTERSITMGKSAIFDGGIGVSHGDAVVARDGEILRCLVGSQVHGLALPNSDHDEMAIYLEPAHYVLGLNEYRGDYISRTQPEGHRSGPGDIDLVAYGLRKYLRLAIKGNPTVLLPLFAPSEAILSINHFGQELRGLRHAFLSQQAVLRFLGFMESQRQRMLGQSKRHVPNRPELIAKYGFDTKYAAHALRLALQGLEITATGDLQLPMRANLRERVLAVKTGQIPQAEVLAQISDLETSIRNRLSARDTPLPEKPDLFKIEYWAIQAQRRFWGW